MTALRLAWRMQRWELLFLVGGAHLIALAAGLVAWQLSVAFEKLGPCLVEAPDRALAATCRSLSEWMGMLGGASAVLQAVTTIVPFVVGILLGAPLASSEIERRTAPMAWSLAPSRGWWLAGRLLPLLVAIAVALLLLGQAMEAMILALPHQSLGFAQYAMHGPLVAARGMAVFGIGALVGLVMGRTLPAILVTGLLVLALVLGLQVGRDQLMRAEASWVSLGDDEFPNVAVVYDSAFRDDATGELTTFEEASTRFPEIFGAEGIDAPSGMSQVYLTTPPERYPLFVARELGVLLIVVVSASVAALALVRIRRPE